MSVIGTEEQARPLGVAMIGYAFMGAAHSQAWRNAHRFFDLPARPAMNVISGRRESATADAAAKLGWRAWTTDWRAVLTRDDIDVVDICTPGDTHAEIALAALEAGKHVLCEKPLANTVAEAEKMATAASSAEQRGVLSMVGFNYRGRPVTVSATSTRSSTRSPISSASCVRALRRRRHSLTASRYSRSSTRSNDRATLTPPGLPYEFGRAFTSGSD